MDDYEKKAFLAAFANLNQSLDPTPLVAEMVTAGLVTENQLDEITAATTARDKSGKILDIVLKHSNKRVFELFTKCIEDADEAQAYLAAMLRDKLREAKMQGPGGESSQQGNRPPDFSDLTGKPSQIELLDHVVDKITDGLQLESFCLRIGLESTESDIAVTDHPGKIQSASNAVLRVWLRGKGKPRTWSTLLEAFHKMGMAAYAEELADKVRSGRL